MIYQLGFGGFNGFKRMIQALKDMNYGIAADEGLDSLWAKQTPYRANKLTTVIRNFA